MTELIGLLSFGSDGWGDELLEGAFLTLRLALATLPFGLVIGLCVALLKNAESPALQALGNLYTTIFRGLPELLTLFIIYFGGQILLKEMLDVVAPGTTVEVSSFVAGIIALSIVFGAFASEVFLAAIRAVPKGQGEAAAALGLSRWQGFRLVLFPQLFRLALPGLGNLWLVLLKDTALVSVIALDDLLRQTNVAVGVTKEPFFFYLVACLLYLAMSLVSTTCVALLEKRYNRGFAGSR
ncbi:MAG: ABC transporter permease [Hyphomicrobiaceae bacterium]|nr:ABC transporter permease [Hyphomicrobiaceae bacterium]